MEKVARWASARGFLGSVVVALMLVASTAAASAEVTLTPAGSPPPADQPALINGFDFGRLGYEWSEYYVAGDARSYHDALPLTSDGAWSVAADPTTAPFRTRLLVLKPSHPWRFNGTVYVEWMNVSGGFDATPDLGFAHNEIVRQGAAYVAVGAQAVGVNAARTTFPDRYGAAGANLVHPGDSYSYDIFSQAGEAVRDNARSIFGRGFRVKRLIADGESQSAGRLTTYVNAFARQGVYDGYMIHSRGASSAPLRQAPLGPITTPNPTLIRTDLSQPVFTFQSETDTRLVRQDSARVRWWEVPGTSHIDIYSTLVGPADLGGLAGARDLFGRMVQPYSGPFPIVGSCTLGLNAGPQHWVFQAALHHLDKWVARGTPPPLGPRMTTSDGTGAGALVLDAHGNVTGGIRTPHLDVPIATLRGTGNTAATPGLNFCALFGTTTPFSAATLGQLYRNHGDFVRKWSRSVDRAVAAGFILPLDGLLVKLSAATSDIGR